MPTITTKYGPIDEELLERRDSRSENDNEIATAQEWYLCGELVRRDAQVQLKKFPESVTEQGVFGG